MQRIEVLEETAYLVNRSVIRRLDFIFPLSGNCPAASISLKGGPDYVAGGARFPKEDTNMLGLRSIASRIFGTANDRKVVRYAPRVAEINALEDGLIGLSDD